MVAQATRPHNPAHTPRNDKPSSPPVEPDNIPCELKAVPQWVAWDYLLRDDEWAKVPLNPRTADPASSTNPDHWSTFDAALASYRDNDLAGVGFVFRDGDPYIGIDLDDCRDPETGELASWAGDVLESVASYAEVSPSGTGVKIFCRGVKPGRDCKGYVSGGGAVEMYDSVRFFTVTGQHLEDTPVEVLDVQEGVAAVYRDFVERDERPRASRIVGLKPPTRLSETEVRHEYRQHEKFNDLWEGRWQSYYGSRSEADLGFCSLLARQLGNDPCAIDRMVRASGMVRPKWEERAEYREDTIRKAIQFETEREGFANYVSLSGATEESPSGKRVGLPLETISENLFRLTGGWPKRSGGVLFVPGDDGRPRWLERQAALFAWIGAQFGTGAVNRVRWAAGEDMVSKEEFLAYLLQAADDYESVEQAPHYPTRAECCYLHPEPRAVGGLALERLLDRFCPATDEDRALIKALFLTVLWGGAPGDRPAWVITSDAEHDLDGGRGVGKSVLADVVSHLVGGAVTLRQGEDPGALVTRLLSPAARGLRVVVRDNVKTHRLSDADFEGLVTSRTISGRQNYVGEGRRPNTLTYVMTINGANLSKDLAQRSVFVHLARPEYVAGWKTDTIRYVDERRAEIFGDILAELERQAEPLARYTRWAEWEQNVLAKCGDPTACQRVIRERQASADDDAAEADLVREAFLENLRSHGLEPDEVRVFYPTRRAEPVVFMASNERRSSNAAMKFLRSLPIQELDGDKYRGVRGIFWTGKAAPPDAPVLELSKRP